MHVHEDFAGADSVADILARVARGERVTVPVGSRADQRACQTRLERAARSRGLLREVRQLVTVRRYKNRTHGTPHSSLGKPQRRATSLRVSDDGEALILTVNGLPQLPPSHEVFEMPKLEDVTDVAPQPETPPPPSTPEPTPEAPPPELVSVAPTSRQARMSEKEAFAVAKMREYPEATNMFIMHLLRVRFGRGISTSLLPKLRQANFSQAEIDAWASASARRRARKPGVRAEMHGEWLREKERRMANAAAYAPLPGPLERDEDVPAVQDAPAPDKPTTREIIFKTLAPIMRQERIAGIQLSMDADGKLSCRVRHEVVEDWS